LTIRCFSASFAKFWDKTALFGEQKPAPHNVLKSENVTAYGDGKGTPTLQRVQVTRRVTPLALVKNICLVWIIISSGTRMSLSRAFTRTLSIGSLYEALLLSRKPTSAMTSTWRQWR